MLIKLAGGTLYDPSQDWNGVVRDIFVREGRIVDDPGPGAKCDAIHDVRGMVVMAGGIDIHSHIAGGNVNTARMLQPEQFLMREDPGELPPIDRACFTAAEIGEHYARMGYTTVVEPAVLPCNARNAHLQMMDIPVIDKAGLAILGNDEFLLRLLRQGGGQSLINDYVAWTIEATQCLALKCINAGGGAAFKQNVRAFGLDDEVPSYGVTSRQILQALHRAAVALGLPHPLHVHCNNLGLPGNIESVLATMEAAEGAPMHLAHVQFYGYGREGTLGLSSAAVQVIAGLEKYPNITIDVGQVQLDQLMATPAESAGSEFSSPAGLANVTLTAERIYYRPDADYDAALNGVSFSARAGERLAIVGPNAGGKSVLLECLAGLRRPQSGRVLIDGRDIRQFDTTEYRAWIGYVPQVVPALPLTVRDYLRLRSPTLSDTDAFAALERVIGPDWRELSAFGRSADKVLDRELNPFSEDIAELQFRHLMAFVAATLNRPAILLLDGDGIADTPEWESRILRYLDSIRGTTTVIWAPNGIAHVQACQQIVVLERGTVLRAGPTAPPLALAS